MELLCMKLRSLLICLALFALAAAPVLADTTIQPATYRGHAAYRMTDGRTEAIIVPDLARVMRYGFVGGPNILWNAATPDPAKPIDYTKWINWARRQDLAGAAEQLASGGGDQQLAPERDPDQSANGGSSAGSALRLTGRVADAWGARIVREYRFGAHGEFQVNQTVEKISGPKVELTIWDIFQSNAPDAIFLPLNKNSPYKTGYQWLILPNTKTAIPLAAPDMTRIAHSDTASYKIGLDSPVAGIVAVKGNLAVVLSASLPKGDYPDGALNAGFPVEFYNMGDSKNPFDELELLGPLTVLGPGDKTSYKITWQLHKLPVNAPNSPAVARLAHQWLFGR